MPVLAFSQSGAPATPDVLLTGEVPGLETCLYINDAAAQAKRKALVCTGHIKREETGMDYCSCCLQTFTSHSKKNSTDYSTF